MQEGITKNSGPSANQLVITRLSGEASTNVGSCAIVLVITGNLLLLLYGKQY